MGRPKINLGSKNIAIVTHRSIMPCIPGDDLKRFLLTHNCKSLLYIKHPLLLLKESYKLHSEVEHYNGNSPVKTSKAPRVILPESGHYIKDFLYTTYWILKSRNTYDLYFGINNLNALAGLVLKKLGKVNKVIYYTIDLYPERFSNTFINWIYHKLDKLCVANCDETWNVSPFMKRFRAENGIPETGHSRQFTVPIGVWLNQRNIIPLNRIKKTKLVFIGHLVAFRGVDLAIKALPIIAKTIPDVTLEIVGGGEQLEYLKQLAQKLQVNQMIKFHGFVESNKTALNIISNSAIALAPYRTKNNPPAKNADPAKIKEYLSLGIPVITTKAPSIAKEIQKARCSMVVNFSTESFADAVIKLLSNRKLWKEYRKNALQYVKQFDWNIIFSKNISRLLG
ncbi:MAG: glycosyltransferase [Candidatus Blackburnbacteria bacterium]|nr:glycosyltransferase [Candidatus Blackburnbacteria bacterium]